MSNINNLLAQILSARYGKDVRKSIHDAISYINGVAGTAQDGAITAANSAKASATSAKASATLAEQYKNDAFAGTPDGYDALVEKVRLMDIQSTTDTTLANSKAGGYKLLSMSGKSVQNEIAIHHVGDCVEMVQGGHNTTTGDFVVSNNAVRSKNSIPCKAGDVLAITSDSENTDANHIYLYYNESGFIKADVQTVVTKTQSTVPSGATHFRIYLSDAYGLLLENVGKISLTINGKYVVRIRIYDDNGSENVATVLLNEPLKESDMIARINGKFYEIHSETEQELDTTSQIALNSLETFDGVTYINVDSRVLPSEIKGEYGASNVGARTIKNELRNDTLEIKYKELAVALVATGSGV